MKIKHRISDIAARFFAAMLLAASFGAVAAQAQFSISPSKQKSDYTALYRLLEPRSGDHLYTTSCEEKRSLQREGNYVYEGVAAYLATREQRRNTALYRLQLANGKHFYTTDYNEATDLTRSANNRLEGTVGYVSSDQQRNTVPFYRLINADGHLYTTDENEKNNFLGAANSRSEGVMGYTWTTGTNLCDGGGSGSSATANAPVIYADPNYQGASEVIERDWEGNPSRIRSIRVPAGWYVVVYDRKNFRGRSLNVTADWSPTDSDMWYGRVRSIKVFQGRPPRQPR